MGVLLMGRLFFATVTMECTNRNRGDSVLYKISTRQTDPDLDHPDPNLPLIDYVRDLYSTDPTQETCPRSVSYTHLTLPTICSL